jgi:hypothetical protein
MTVAAAKIAAFSANSISRKMYGLRPTKAMGSGVVAGSE